MKYYNLKYLIIAVILFCSLNKYSQVSISDMEEQQANSSAVLDLISDDKGFLLPRMDTDNRDAITEPANSLMIFNNEKKCIEVWVEGWQELWCYEDESDKICGNNITFEYPKGSGNNVIYGTVESSITGECWLDRNLGSISYDEGNNNTYEPSSNSDYNFYGDLFQWGRLDDGHQVINWTDSESGTPNTGTTEDLSTTNVPGHDLFITTDIVSGSPFDWITPQNDDLWNEDNGEILNNPCPEGWRVPTLQEWQAESNSWGNKHDAFDSDLMLTIAGRRNNLNGSLSDTGTKGYYWSNTVPSGSGANGLMLEEDDVNNSETSSYARTFAMSIRCIKQNNNK